MHRSKIMALSAASPAPGSETVSSIFFSLRGTLPRHHWYLAMVAAIAVFTGGASLLAGGEREVFAPTAHAAPSWMFLGWCVAFLCVVTLLCAKRLLDCGRPAWLALPILPSGILFILAFATGVHFSWTAVTVMAWHLALFAVPAFIACALYELDD